MYLTARPRKLVPSKADLAKLAGAIGPLADVEEIGPDQEWRTAATKLIDDLEAMAAYLKDEPDEPGVDTAEAKE